MLNFPSNPSVGDKYQVGNSAEYIFTSQGFWQVIRTSPTVILNAISSSYATFSETAESSSHAQDSDVSISSSFAQTASFSITSSFSETASFSVSSSFSETASFSVSASFTVSSSLSVSSSFSETSSYSVSSSFSVTSSFSETSSYSVTSSHSIEAISASFSETASFVHQAVSASFSSFAQEALSGSYSVFADAALSASYAQDSDLAISASFAQTSSYSLFASDSRNSVSASYALTASHVLGASETSSYALTASFVRQAVSASYALTSSFAVFALDSDNAISSSYALTASHCVGLIESASYAMSASFARTAATASLLRHSIDAKEVHVSIEGGVDAIGRGTLLYPYKSIGYALTRIGNTSGVRLIIHRGQYAENLNITATNMSIAGYNAGNGALVELNGTVTVNVPADASTRISNLRMNRLVHQNTGGIFVNNISVTQSALFSGQYAEIVDSRFECPAGISHTAGRLFVFSSIFSPLTTNGATAVAYIKDAIGVAQPTLTAGMMVLVNCQVTAAVANQPAINTGAGSNLSLVNTSISTATGALARINVLGNLSYQDAVFDKRNSVMGTQVPIISRFQGIDVNQLQVTGSVQVQGNLRASTGITGSLFGTASFAQNSRTSVSSSFALNAQTSVSSSYALTASFVESVVSASYSETASYVASVVSASFAQSSSYALTASYLLNAPVGGTSVIISDTAPVGESQGALWFNSDTDNGAGGEMYILMDDATSNWVPINDNFINEAVSSSFSVYAQNAGAATSSSFASTRQRPQYITARKNTNQTLVGSNTDVTFQVVEASNGLSLVNNSVTLTGGKVYQISATFGSSTFSDASGGLIIYGLYDAANSRVSFISALTASPASTVNNSSPTMNVIYAPTVDTAVKFRVATAVGTSTLTTASTSFTIAEII